MKQDTIVVFDYGSQYTRLISRRLREINVFCDLVYPEIDKSFFDERNIKGFILSGGPNSVFEENSPDLPRWVMESKLPILGICYGMQLIAINHQGKVKKTPKREYQLNKTGLKVTFYRENLIAKNHISNVKSIVFIVLFIPKKKGAEAPFKIFDRN